MLLGLGTDIVETARLQRSIERYGAHFLNHVFTREEQEKAPEHGEARFAYYAGRWAAKEAISKALGTGFTAQCAWTDLNITNLDSGKPVVHLSGAAADTAAALGIRHIHLSISHDRNYATAVAVAES